MKPKQAKTREKSPAVGPVEIPPADPLYTQPWSFRKMLGLLAVFGPAAIVASVSIGAGETIVVVREGAWAGYGRLWLVLLSCLAKGICVTYFLGRYTAVTGELIGHRLVRLPGPRGWLLITLLGLEMLGAPPVWAAISRPCGDLIHFLLKDWLPTGLPEPVWENLFTTAFISLALVLGISLPLAQVERQQVIICGILVAGTILGTVMVRPDLGKALAGTLSFGHIPPVPPWGPQDAVQRPWLTMATTFAYVGGSVLGYVVYANWVGMHGWGLNRHEQIEAIRERAFHRDRPDYLPEGPDQVRRMRLALSPLRWDVGMGAVVLFIVTAAFMISGAAVLYPLETRFEGWSLLTNQAHIWSRIHPALVWVYYISIAAAMWGTLQALPEIYARVAQEFAQAVWPERQWDYLRIKVVLCTFVFLFTSVLVWGNVPFDVLTQIAGFILSNLAIALVMVAALYLNFLLPPAYRTRPLMLVGGILSALVLIVFAGLSGWGLLMRLLGSG